MDVDVYQKRQPREERVFFSPIRCPVFRCELLDFSLKDCGRFSFPPWIHVSVTSKGCQLAEHVLIVPVGAEHDLLAVAPDETRIALGRRRRGFLRLGSLGKGIQLVIVVGHPAKVFNAIWTHTLSYCCTFDCRSKREPSRHVPQRHLFRLVGPSHRVARRLPEKTDGICAFFACFHKIHLTSKWPHDGKHTVEEAKSGKARATAGRSVSDLGGGCPVCRSEQTNTHQAPTRDPAPGSGPSGAHHQSGVNALAGRGDEEIMLMPHLGKGGARISTSDVNNSIAKQPCPDVSFHRLIPDKTEGRHILWHKHYKLACPDPRQL